ncbi:hypothetical protein SAMN04488156_13112 [Bacillus sp. 166amftsu]|nr:hypothetical protein SAMN04488156_13112 [Bacillus sp. 166amftsu]
MMFCKESISYEMDSLIYLVISFFRGMFQLCMVLY